MYNTYVTDDVFMPVFCFVQAIPSFFSKEISKKKNVNLSACQSSHSETVSSSKIQYLYYKVHTFQHFYYIYKLTRECTLRISGENRCPSSIIETDFEPKDVILKIGIVGAFTEENLRFISKIKGKRKSPKDQTVWKVTPLLCFQNDLDLNSAKELLRQQDTSEKTSDKILIKSANVCDEIDKITDSLIIIDENKEDIARTITSCFEEPIIQMLQKWLKNLETEGLGKHTSRVVAEIKAISKQLTLNERNIRRDVSDPSICKTLVPGDIKDYLFGKSDVNAFGIWNNSSFKIFVKTTTVKEELEGELVERYHNFFKYYPLDIEFGILIENPILKQGDPIYADDCCEKHPTGTLGGFVMRVNEDRKKYALTCNHIFPSRNKMAYADDSDDGARRQIGSCVFTKNDMSCDFAAIEMNDTISNKCDVTFRRDDGKGINAHLYDENLEDVGIVHKIGATTGVTQGYILSSEFYNKYPAEGNRECIFLVKGTHGNFSEEGDSGSLVFSRPRSVQQNYVDIVGMVYAKNRKAKDDVETEVYNRTDKESEQLHANHDISTEVENAHENNPQNCTPSLSSEYDGTTTAENDQDDDEYSCCYRLHTALELFEEDQGQGFEVRFKDDLSLSSPATSSSSGSDVEAV